MTIDGFDQDRDENSMTTIIEPGIAPTEPLLSLPTTSSMTPQSVSSSEPPPEPQLLPSPGPYSESPPPRLNDRSSTLSGPTAHSPPSMLNVVLAAGNDVSSHLAPSITIVSSQLVTGAPLTSRTDGVNSSSRSSSGCDSGAAAIAAGSQPARRSFRQRLKDKLSKFQKKK
ncbi:hypothetical protein BC939DRAFT_438881 [Gamsiella multidivaricata]|uniref:uncharacterized protein n=1 Tax=Gamsiella multidivaricata TaxID=101098 RepID=UPI00221FDD66|nr:uncharacterized protein BC939DRAFT_438881 [Gamsiella multidivaricata]KAI7830721.1 hypothetical protein BC939DRAFT_438881 [Gamsiella multidivaricata]